MSDRKTEPEVVVVIPPVAPKPVKNRTVSVAGKSSHLSSGDDGSPRTPDSDLSDESPKQSESPQQPKKKIKAPKKQNFNTAPTMYSLSEAAGRRRSPSTDGSSGEGSDDDSGLHPVSETKTGYITPPSELESGTSSSVSSSRSRVTVKRGESPKEDESPKLEGVSEDLVAADAELKQKQEEEQRKAKELEEQRKAAEAKRKEEEEAKRKKEEKEKKDREEAEAERKKREALAAQAQVAQQQAASSRAAVAPSVVQPQAPVKKEDEAKAKSDKEEKEKKQSISQAPQEIIFANLRPLVAQVNALAQAFEKATKKLDDMAKYAALLFAFVGDLKIMNDQIPKPLSVGLFSRIGRAISPITFEDELDNAYIKIREEQARIITYGPSTEDEVREYLKALALITYNVTYLLKKNEVTIGLHLPFYLEKLNEIKLLLRNAHLFDIRLSRLASYFKTLLEIANKSLGDRLPEDAKGLIKFATNKIQRALSWYEHTLPQNIGILNSNLVALSMNGELWRSLNGIANELVEQQAKLNNRDLNAEEKESISKAQKTTWEAYKKVLSQCFELIDSIPLFMIVSEEDLKQADRVPRIFEADPNLIRLVGTDNNNKKLYRIQLRPDVAEDIDRFKVAVFNNPLAFDRILVGQCFLSLSNSLDERVSPLLYWDSESASENYNIAYGILAQLSDRELSLQMQRATVEFSEAFTKKKRECERNSESEAARLAVEAYRKAEADYTNRLNGYTKLITSFPPFVIVCEDELDRYRAHIPNIYDINLERMQYAYTDNHNRRFYKARLRPDVAEDMDRCKRAFFTDPVPHDVTPVRQAVVSIQNAVNEHIGPLLYWDQKSFVQNSELLATILKKLNDQSLWDSLHAAFANWSSAYEDYYRCVRHKDTEENTKKAQESYRKAEENYLKQLDVYFQLMASLPPFIIISEADLKQAMGQIPRIFDVNPDHRSLVGTNNNQEKLYKIRLRHDIAEDIASFKYTFFNQPQLRNITPVGQCLLSLGNAADEKTSSLLYWDQKSVTQNHELIHGILMQLSDRQLVNNIQKASEDLRNAFAIYFTARAERSATQDEAFEAYKKEEKNYLRQMNAYFQLVVCLPPFIVILEEDLEVCRNRIPRVFDFNRKKLISNDDGKKLYRIPLSENLTINLNMVRDEIFSSSMRDGSAANVLSNISHYISQAEATQTTAVVARRQSSVSLPQSGTEITAHLNLPPLINFAGVKLPTESIAAEESKAREAKQKSDAEEQERKQKEAELKLKQEQDEKERKRQEEEKHKQEEQERQQQEEKERKRKEEAKSPKTDSKAPAAPAAHQLEAKAAIDPNLAYRLERESKALDQKIWSEVYELRNILSFMRDSYYANTWPWNRNWPHLEDAFDAFQEFCTSLGEINIERLHSILYNQVRPLIDDVENERYPASSSLSVNLKQGMQELKTSLSGQDSNMAPNALAYKTSTTLSYIRILWDDVGAMRTLWNWLWHPIAAYRIRQLMQSLITDLNTLDDMLSRGHNYTQAEIDGLRGRVVNSATKCLEVSKESGYVLPDGVIRLLNSTQPAAPNHDKGIRNNLDLLQDKRVEYRQYRQKVAHVATSDLSAESSSTFISAHELQAAPLHSSLVTLPGMVPENSEQPRGNKFR